VEEIVVGIAGVLVTVVVSAVSLAYWLGRRLAELDHRLRAVEGRLQSVNSAVENRLQSVYSMVESRFQSVESEFVKFREEVREKFGELYNRLDALARRVGEAMANTHSLILEYMGVRGMFSRSEIDFLVAQVRRFVASVVLNPISREELELIKRVFSKDLDDMTIEELEKVAEIAKRWYVEEGSEIALRILHAAVAARAYKLHEQFKRGQAPG